MNTQIRKFYEADDYGSGGDTGNIQITFSVKHNAQVIGLLSGKGINYSSRYVESPSPAPLSDKPVVGKSKEEIATVLYNEYCKLCETHLVNHAVKKIIAKALDQALPVKSDAVIINIERMKDDSGREGCTYGDTNYDSLSAVYGYNLAIGNIVSMLKNKCNEK